MLLESIRLADKELGLTSLNLDDYVKLTDESLLFKLLSLSDDSDELKRAKEFAQDYQNRRLLKCVFERILTNKTKLGKMKTNELRTKISKKSLVNKNEIFIDSSITPSIPLGSSKKETHSIILVTKNISKLHAEKIPISKIPSVSQMSGFMNILRVYTSNQNRKKVEIAAKSILGGLR
jgi:hypothetical protein